MRGLPLLMGLAVASCVINPEFDEPAETESSATSETTGSDGPLGDLCPALGPADGPVVTVSPAQQADLNQIIRDVEPGTTLEFASGVYPLRSGLFIEKPGITLRSASGNPADVVLDGSAIDNTIVFIQAPDVTVAEMTLSNGPLHLIHVSGGVAGDANNVTVYGVDLVDPTLSALKLNPANGAFADNGVLACSTLRLTDAKRNSLAECSVSGVGAVGTAGWRIHDNRIDGFWCASGSAPGITVIESSADFQIERNVIIDSQESIRLGVFEVPDDGSRSFPNRPGCTEIRFDYYGGLVANNMIVASGQGIASSDLGFYTGVALWQVCGTTVVHNTIASAVGAVSSIEYRFARSQQKVLNNLVTHPFRDRDGADAPIAGNLEVEGLGSFVDPLGGDVHLVAGAPAIDAGVLLGADALTYDIDGDVRVDPPDVGADEF